ncbi:MAG: hypothetical protein HY756_08210 [Nitrospirae bacterium]|nr:hypothetical protein [Nitrospirota bacterium]
MGGKVLKAFFVVIVAISCMFHISAFAADYSFTYFDYPGAGFTFGWGINSSNKISGYYHENSDLTSPTHGFFYDGTNFTAKNFPGASQTRTYGINDLGNVTGYYIDTGGVRHGFLYDGNTYTPFDVSGASNTYSYGINDSNKVVGYYEANGTAFGYLKDGNAFTTIQFPGSPWTVAYDINNAGKTVGQYYESNWIGHGFIYDGTTFTTLDFPGANYTRLFGINDSGTIVGEYKDSGGVLHGFTYSAGTFTTFDVQGAQRTAPMGINNSGNITGAYLDSNGKWRGFLAVAALPVACNAENIRCVPSEYSIIQDAVNAAQSGDTIRIAEGLFYENSIWIYKSLNVEGGWNSNFTAQYTRERACNPVDLSLGMCTFVDYEKTIIDGTVFHNGENMHQYCQNLVGLNPNNSECTDGGRMLDVKTNQRLGRWYICNGCNGEYSGKTKKQVFLIRPEGSNQAGINVTMRNLTIQNGRAMSGCSEEGGGVAVCNSEWKDNPGENVTFLMENNLLRNNNHQGVFIGNMKKNMTATLIRNIFEDNFAIEGAGAFFMLDGGDNFNITIDGNEFYNNIATQGAGVNFMSGLYSMNPAGNMNAKLLNNIFKDNISLRKDYDDVQCRGIGGALEFIFPYIGPPIKYDYKFDITLEKNIVTNNTSPSGSGIFIDVGYTRLLPDAKIRFTSIDNVITNNRFPANDPRIHPEFCNFDYNYKTPLGGLTIQLHDMRLINSTFEYLSTNDLIQNNDIQDIGLVYPFETLNKIVFKNNNSKIGVAERYCADENADGICGDMGDYYNVYKTILAEPVFSYILDGFIYTENAGTAYNNWDSKSGTWRLEDNQGNQCIAANQACEYSGSGDGMNISLSKNSPTSHSMTIEADFYSQPDGYSRNGFIIFDYKSPTDFKYVQFWDKANRWGIGSYNGTWNGLISVVEQIDTQRWYRIRVVINGNTVTIYADDDRDGSGFVYKTEATFADIGTGSVGLATWSSHTHFDNFSVNYNVNVFDDFNDGNNDDWEVISGNWSVINGIYDGSSGNWGSAISVLNVNKGKTESNTTIEADFKIKNDGFEVMAFFIFDYKDPNNYKYAMARADGDSKKWVIGYYNGNFNKIGEYLETISKEKWYRMKVAINGNTVTLYAKDLDSVGGYNQKLQATFDSVNNPIGTGQIGLKTFASHAQFDNFEVSY